MPAEADVTPTNPADTAAPGIDEMPDGEAVDDSSPEQAEGPADGPIAQDAEVASPSAPQVTATLCDATASQLTLASEHSLLVDTVIYQGLEPGQRYSCTARLISTEGVAEDGQSESPAWQAEVSFVPTAAQGAVALTFSLDTSGLVGQQLWANEQLHRTADEEGGEPTLCATHEGIDTSCPVRVARLSDRLGLLTDDSSSTAATPQLVDTLSYEGLEPGAEYEAWGSVYVQPEGGSEPVALTDAEGRPATAWASFATQASAGTVELAFSLEDVDYGDDPVQVRTELRREGVTLASHVSEVADSWDLEPAEVMSPTPERQLSLGPSLPALDVRMAVFAVSAAGLLGALLVVRRRIRDVPYAVRRRRRHYVS